MTPSDINIYIEQVEGDRKCWKDRITEDIAEAKIALLGVGESSNRIREKFYSLYPQSTFIKIIDLGNLKKGQTDNDTRFAFTEVAKFLIKENIILVVIGGSQDLTYSLYKAYSAANKVINLVSLDPIFDLGEMSSEINPHSYLSNIIVDKPNYLFNYSHLAYQTYLVEEEAIALMHKLYFDVERVGEVHSNLANMEPYFRSADCISVDMSVVRSADNFGNSNNIPTGLSAEEICQLMHYAGISNQTTSVGIFNYSAEKDIRSQSAFLQAEMLWCFVNGVSNRMYDSPFEPRIGITFKKFIVLVQDNELTFLKCDQTDRWWIELPYEAGRIIPYGQTYFIPCTINDYNEAMQNKIPDRWWNAFKKLR
ncbi:MAG: formimidoylglutamase [Bacteroidales bacterium]|jgi:arginase family enzyme|nr:formimidoylglutamase [Bacteroidales bacterium]